MTSVGSYFCPDDGWEGDEPICPLCFLQAESLEYTGDDEETAKEDILPEEELSQIKDYIGGKNDDSAQTI